MNAHGNGPKVVYIVSPLSGMKGLQMGYFSRTHLDSVEPFNQNNVDELFQKLQGMCGSATSLIWELQGITMQRDPHSWPKFADQMRDDVGFESTQFVELPFDVGSGITRETVMFCVCTHQKAPERQQIVRPDGIRLMKEAEGAVTVLKDGCKKRVFFNERNMSATQKSLRGVMQATDVAIEFEKTDYAVVISNTSEAPLVWILNGAHTVAQYVADGGNRNGFCMTVYDLGCGVSRSLLILTVAIQKTGVFVKRCVGIEGDTSRYLLSSLFVSKCSKKLKEEGRFPPAGIEIVQGDFTSPVIFKKSCFSLS
mmetsp:Transcript_31455/g.62166  ORF Transcript_31455/g.62166 Transcript_31455/m.62166 type:complete len:310 (-) Transcript_31455:349-1278(-)